MSNNFTTTITEKRAPVGDELSAAGRELTRVVGALRGVVLELSGTQMDAFVREAVIAGQLLATAKWLCADDAALLLGRCSTKHLMRLSDDGAITRKYSGKNPIYERASVDAYLESACGVKAGNGSSSAMGARETVKGK